MMKNKTIFVGGDFIESQYLWIIPFINGYCKNNKIKNILFEVPLTYRLQNNKDLLKILDNYNIKILQYNHLYYLGFFFLFFRNFFLYLDLLFLKSSFFKKKIKNLIYEIKHSFWDTLVKEQVNYYKFNFFLRLKCIMHIHNAFAKAYYLQKLSISTVIVGHTVYSRRTLLANLKAININIITQANFSFQFQSGKEDISWDFLNKKLIAKLLNKTSDFESSKYWDKRLLGHGNYEDANISANIQLQNNLSLKTNFVMLHIFRDSPFNFLDRKRIFCDYYDWISNTLNILKTSNEQWVIRIHPNAERWGEDSLSILNQIINSTIKTLPTNIKIDNSTISMRDLYNNAKRIVTFSGTAHIEAACFGIKPIIISETMLSKYNNSFIIKPQNIKEYEDILLCNYEESKFRLSTKELSILRKLLYLRENAYTFRKDVNAIYIYRNDKRDLYDKDYDLTNAYFKKYNNYLFELGMKLNNNFTNTISKRYLENYH